MERCFCIGGYFDGGQQNVSVELAFNMEISRKLLVVVQVPQGNLN